MSVKSGRQNDGRRLHLRTYLVQSTRKGGAKNFVFSTSRQRDIAGRSESPSFPDLVPAAAAGEGRVVVDRNKSDLATREEVLLCPVTVQGPEIGDYNRPIPAAGHNLRGQGHRIEEAVTGCAIATRVVGGWSGDNEGSPYATVYQVEGGLHREAGCRHRRVEGPGRNATILRIQPSTAGRRSLPDSLDITRIMYPGKRTDRVFVWRQRAFTIHHPTTLGPCGQRVEHYPDPFRRIRMAKPGQVFQTPWVRTHAERHIGNQLCHGAMIANKRNDFGFRIFHPPTTTARLARRPEVPGIPIRRESACLASSREPRSQKVASK